MEGRGGIERKVFGSNGCVSGGAPCAVPALCEKSAVFLPPVATGPRVLNSAPYSPCWYTRDFLFQSDACHGSQGPEFCTPPCCFEWIMQASVGVVFRGVPGINNVIIGAVRALCENAPSAQGYIFHAQCRA